TRGAASVQMHRVDDWARRCRVETVIDSRGLTGCRGGSLVVISDVKAVLAGICAKTHCSSDDEGLVGRSWALEDRHGAGDEGIGCAQCIEDNDVRERIGGAAYVSAVKLARDPTKRVGLIQQ